MPDVPQPDSLDQLRARINHFVQERDWEQFHTPKNLAMAMIVEAAEVVEHFQWDSPQESITLSEERKTEIGHELADTLVYLLRIAEVCGIDLIAAANAKIVLNAKKYPVEKAKGSNAKYTAYQDQ
ncbi:nucleotide pyrophosphohydrolase [Methylobacillus gramineus]|uniref:nucleotide pyrophosphohydrolase n=1 Tax=Methylobacillus gramineus TaxID=755169 RepID=UPI001D0009F1|nr:nucleotide pyrophosphohydrolase [Methylobacillus gramineus]MCB5184078.1 nucleotide pyrophosphohydrolase [Methylobacillus gramineus]